MNFLEFPYISKTEVKLPDCDGKKLLDNVYMTMAISDGTNPLKLVEANAPSTSCRITESVDYTAYKFLGKDIFVGSFGDKPVEIIIGGINILATYAPNTGNITNVPELYNKYKLSANPSARFDIGLAWTNNQAAYKCVLVEMGLDASARDITDSGYSEYELKFIGVSKKNFKFGK